MFYMKYRFIVCLLLMFFYNKNHAQNIKFKNFLTENGLSNNSVNTIEVDNEGVLWIGTWDGVNYYDGHEFIIYKNIPNDSTSLPNNFIHKIIKDGNNRIWVLSDGNKVSLVKDKQFKNFEFSEKVENIKLSKRKEVLIKSDNKYYKYHGNEFIRCNKPNIIDDNVDIKRIFKSIYPNVRINISLKDSRGNIWIGSKSNGLFFISSEKIFNIKKGNIQNYKKDFYDRFSLESNEIYEIKEDGFKNIWIGTKDGGLSRVYKNSNAVYFIANHPIKQNNLPSETIRAITVDNKDKIWLGFYRQGIFIEENKGGKFTKLELYPPTKNKDWNKIRSLFKASDGSIFGGTYAGIFRYNNGNIDYFSSEKTPYFANNRNYAFYENKKQQIYVASWGGLSLFDLRKNSFVELANQSKLTDYHIRDIIQIKNKVFLATEKNGIIIYNSDSNISKIDKKIGLLDNSVYSFWYDDLNENLWIATLGGISIYSMKNYKIIKNITEKEGLTSHFVYGFLNHKNNVWCSTTNGLVTIDKNTYDIFLHPGSEGFQSAEFSEGAYYKDSKDFMYFGGVKGLNFFNPDLLNLEEQLPIIKVCLDNEKPKEINEKKYKNNYAKFTIDPTFYGESNGNKIYYKLEGYDKNWIALDYSVNVIDYNNLSANKYVFKVKNAKVEGKINKIKLIIKKPFWQQFIFYILLFLFFLILLILYLLIKRKIQNKREKILENKIEDRVKVINKQKQSILLKNKELIDKNLDILKQKQELQKLHAKLRTESMEVDKFSTYIVNEYKIPLTKINQEIESSKTEKIKIKKLVNKLMNKILAYEYLTQLTYKDKINETTLEIESAIERILKGIVQNLNKNKIKFSVNKNTEKFWVSIDLLKFKLLLKYLISDICKFPDKSSVLNITYKLKPDLVEISFSSNNPILSENLYHIEHYSPYFQTCKTIAFLMKINLKIIKNNVNSVIKISFKPKLVAPEEKSEIKLNWMHMQLNNQLDDNKLTLLVWSEIEDKSIIKYLLPDTYNIIIENKKEILLSILKSISVNIFVIYNKNMNQEIYQMINHINKKYQKIKTIYISESISYEIEYQTMEMGIDTCIQLPVNEKYINKKIKNLLKYEKNLEEENILSRVKKITDINNIDDSEKIIHKSLKIIQENINNSNFNVTKLSEELKISKIKCYRIFKEILGIPPSEFILEIKMKKAENLLLNSSLNIAEISYEIGFSDPKYFSKVFKKIYGKSPKKYKKSIKKKE